MKTLLRIDASAQLTGSHSRLLADYYQDLWEAAHPGGRVVRRDLAADPLPHLDEATVGVFYTGGEPGEGTVPQGIALSDTLIGELREADQVVVSSAVYNFGITSSLKAWIDHVIRFGHTITRGEKGVSGLLGGRSACLLTARGGNAATSPEFLSPTVRAVFQYMGFSRFDWVSLEGTKIPDGRLDERIAAARIAMNALFENEVQN
jgi:FMN-dependent NADH-azoreductase